MGKYIKLFKTEEQYEEFVNSASLRLPNVSSIYDKRVCFDKWRPTPLYFEAIELMAVSFTRNNIEYSLNNRTWYSLSAGSTTPTINAGERIYVRATNPSISSSYGIGTFSCTGKCNVGGNIMSLLYGDDFVGKTSLKGNYQFCKLFQNNTNIIDASQLVLPTTTLAYECYGNMFSGCKALTTAPKLPATTLTDYCYRNMFYGCTSLTTAPELPATTLAERCYSSMFNGCTSLTTAPELPATTLKSYCYSTMFSDCTSLTTAPELPATTLKSYCYSSMFFGCKGLTRAPELPATTLADHCYDTMFSNCTSLTTAPELPATTLANYCYGYMFYICTSLTTAPELPATTLAECCYQYMFYDCTSLTTAPELPATTLAECCYRYMFDGCSKLNHITMLATNISASNCLSDWVSGVASTGTFIKNPNMTSLPTGTSGIPSGWTVQNYAN